MINHGKMDNGPLHPDWGRTPSLPNVAEDMARLIRERDAAVAATITFDKTDIAEMLTAAALKLPEVAAMKQALAKLRDLMCENFEDDDGNSGCGQCQDDCTGCLAHATLAGLEAKP